MPNSTAVITDTNTLANTTFNSASLTKSGTADVALVELAEAAAGSLMQAKKQLQQLLANTDTSDPQYTLASDIIGTLS